MPIKFRPNFRFTRNISEDLARIEQQRERIANLPITASVLEGLRKTARLKSTHYSTKIEGNRLTLKEVQLVLFENKTIPNRKRDEDEVEGYYAALEFVKRHGKSKQPITEKTVQMLHALVMDKGRKKVKPSVYRDDQNVIRESSSGSIVYLPPEAQDVPGLMKALVEWIQNSDLPTPLIAGIAHYQLATIHPYWDGNGRVARLLATLILHTRGYDQKGIYSLDEYYERDLPAYYDALQVDPSHNYYMGRADADITDWVEYFCNGVARSFESVTRRAKKESLKKKTDQFELLQDLDKRQQITLDLFRRHKTITSAQIAELFGVQPRTARKLCQEWVSENFLLVADPSRKARKYQLSPKYEALLVT